MGSATSETAARVGERITRAAIVSAIWRPLPTTSMSASRMNSVSDWTSDVSRDTSRPARSRSKKPSGSACSLSKAAVRSEPRKRSPAVAASSVCARTTNGFRTTSARRMIAATSSGCRACFAMPESTAYRTSAGPARVISVDKTTATAAPA